MILLCTYWTKAESEQKLRNHLATASLACVAMAYSKDVEPSDLRTSLLSSGDAICEW